MIDSEDAERLSAYPWHLDSNGYVTTCLKTDEGKWTNQGMHRIIMGLLPGDGRVVDHINRNPLDNRKENLRVCSRRANLLNQGKRRDNTSGAPNVYWDSSSRSYFVKVAGFQSLERAADAAAEVRRRREEEIV